MAPQIVLLFHPNSLLLLFSFCMSDLSHPKLMFFPHLLLNSLLHPLATPEQKVVDNVEENSCKSQTEL
jgi:hypothetical protein